MSRLLSKVGWPGREAARRLELKSVAESLSLFAARASAALLSFLANLYLAKVLGIYQFGTYSLALAVLTVCSLFMDSGYFASGARLIVGTHDEGVKRGYLGAMIGIGAAISVLFVAIISALALMVDVVFEEPIGPMLQSVAVVTPALVAPLVIDQALKAMGRIYLFGVWQTTPRLLFLAAVVYAGALGGLSASTALALSLLSGLIAAVPVILLARPSFKDLVSRLREIRAEQNRFGRQLYIGKVANLASYNVDKLLLGFFRDAPTVGYYSLAMSFGGPVAMFGQSVAASRFREFAHLRPISRRLLLWNFVGILIVSVAVLVAGTLVIYLYLGPTYYVVVPLLVLSLIAIGCQAGYQPYNSWLLANGFGLELKRFLIVVAAINIVANLTLIPTAGAVGAAIASAVGMGAYWILAARSYREQVLRRGVS